MSAYLVVRELTGSELGWFAEPRKTGKARGRQRGINFNTADAQRIFPASLLAAGEVPVVSRRFSDGATQDRHIRLQQKNWRLVGDMVRGAGLEHVDVGDFLWAFIEADSGPRFVFLWDVVTKTGNPELHAQLVQKGIQFIGGMKSWPADDSASAELAATICSEASGTSVLDRFRSEAVKARSSKGTPAVQAGAKTEAVPEEQTTVQSAAAPESAPSSAAAEKPKPKRRRIEDRLHRPHILTEILKSGMALSAAAQADFIDVLDALAAELRRLLCESSLICRVEINQRKAWDQFRGVPIGFVDGGVANVTSLGAAPVAIRVGSYVVTPGETGQERERFDFELQLVDDLYESSTIGSGVYEDFFEDVAKLRDAARIACEVAGMVSLARKDKPPLALVLHGPLVNPVSPYALGVPGQPGAFPNFSAPTLAKLLPGDSKTRSGRDANFVAVYLEQLKILESWSGGVCGVVERTSSSVPGPLISLLTDKLHAGGRIDADTRREFTEKMEAYRLTDTVIFECVLEQGEYVPPLEMDKQGPDFKIPREWETEIKSYPRPLVTYVKPSAETVPVRVEWFPTKMLTHSELMCLIVHMSRLLPRYSFPVGLDIVDKHTKVPEWMSRQMNVMLSTQLMRKAMESGSPATIRMVRRILCANTRDWLFRPDFRKG
jgi:hypothetical protein